MRIKKKSALEMKDDLYINNTMLEKGDRIVVRKSEGKKDYVIYHNSYSGAISEVENLVIKNGMIWNPDEVFTKVSTGTKKPKEGDIVKFYLQLYTPDHMPAGKAIHVQVYGMGDRYELNAYFSPLKAREYFDYPWED
ncbi:MAG: hypothetical protein EOM67_07860 [Spirochaetia bacterium]|jgi:signal peptidase I|nr:hypothetical protein [Spirochaetia bacterium]